MGERDVSLDAAVMRAMIEANDRWWKGEQTLNLYETLARVAVDAVREHDAKEKALGLAARGLVSEG